MNLLAQWLALFGTALVAASAAWGAAPAKAATTLLCEPVYMPAREVWARKVELVERGGRLSEVRIDGQVVYSFAVSDSVVMTSQDNERIRIDLANRTWHSEFRGLASGQGQCELSE